MNPTQPWRAAWQDALYGPSGFYRRNEGPAGHFATSTQGIPGVPEVLAQTVIALAQRYDVDAVVDFACGRGELLTTLATYEPKVDLIGIDVVARPAELPTEVLWVESPGGATIPDLAALAGRRVLVLAHEWLDVVPCTIAESDDEGRLREVLVSTAGEESLGSPVSGDELTWARRHWPRDAGPRVEIGLARDEAWSALCTAVRRRAEAGSVAIGVDYGHTVHDRPPLGTLTGFADGIECTPIPDGGCDITAHVSVDSLEIDSVCTQRELLLELFGDEALAPVPIELASSNPPAYLQRLATRSALSAAVSPDGLGAFHWFTKML